MMTPDDVAASLGRNDGGFGRDQQSYYDLPVLRKPHWEWEIEWYFYVGGIASGCAILAALTDVVRDPDDAEVVRIGRYTALAGATISGVLLIKDLGRPERFLKMLRIVKLKSPMSVGVYALSTFSTLSAFAFARQAAADKLVPFDPFAFVPGALLDVAWAGSAALLGSYTGVLVGATAIPVWFAGSRHLPAIFVCSATATACAFTLAVLACLPHANATMLQKLERLEIFASLCELALLRDYRRVAGRLGKPLFAGALGRKLLTMTEILGIAAPVALNAASALGRVTHAGAASRVRTLVAATLTLVGGFVLRQCVLQSGKASADDPRAYLNHAHLQANGAP